MDTKKDIITTTVDTNTQFDTILAAELSKRLKRTPSHSERINADTDSDLVNETLWQIILKLSDRVTALEANSTVKKQ